MRKERRRVCATATLVLLISCNFDAPPTPPQANVSDSAGTRIVAFAELIGADIPEWRARALFSSTDAGLDLYAVTGARFLPDGTLAVANSGSFEIVRFSDSGRLIARIGRDGEGPGEFRSLTRIDVSREGKMLAYDARLARLSVFGLDGLLIETRPLSSQSRIVDLLPLAFGSDGSVLATYGAFRVFGATGIGRDSIPFFRLAPDGSGRDTLGHWRGKEWAFASVAQGAARAPVPFGHDVAFAGRNGRAVIGSTDSVSLTVVDLDRAMIWRLRSGDHGVPISTEIRERSLNEARTTYENSPPELRNLILNNVPETYPVFDAVAIDEHGRVWIGAYPTEGERTRRWVVVSPDGSVAGAVSLPARSRILDIAGDLIAVLDRSDLDEESVRVLRFVP